MAEPRKSPAPRAAEQSWSRFHHLVADVRERAENHRIAAESARVAYYVFLSLFPFLLALFAVTGYLGREAAFTWIMEELLAALPQPAAEALADSVRQVTHVRRPGTLSLSLLLTFWSASHALAALADGLNAAFRVGPRQRWWQNKIVGLVVIVIGNLAVLVGALAVLAGPEIGGFVGLEQLGSLMRWPVAVGLVVGMTWLAYFVLPNRSQARCKLQLLGGAAFATALWAGFTFLFRLYLSSFARLDLIYGVLGGVVALMVWLYLAAMSILVGGEVAAALERHARRRRPSEVADGSATTGPVQKPAVSRS